jgi:hypothetical protein
MSAIPKRSHQKARREAEGFLSSLQSQIVTAKALTASAAADLAAGAFQAYQRYREALNSISGVSALIVDRLAELPADIDAEVHRRFHSAIGDLLIAEIDASLSIFLSLAATESLPLGSRELFEEELGHLIERREMIERPDYADIITPEVRVKLDKARAVLEEISSRAPGLIELSRARYQTRRNKH